MRVRFLCAICLVGSALLVGCSDSDGDDRASAGKAGEGGSGDGQSGTAGTAGAPQPGGGGGTGAGGTGNAQAGSGAGAGGTGGPAAAGCGDSELVDGEECDDGNAVAGDGCSASCAVEIGFECDAPGEPCTAVCGDRVVRGDEACDDGNQVDDDYCSNDCATASSCGDGDVQSNEECDDGNTDTEECAYGDEDCGACDAACKPVAKHYCGDSVVEEDAGEECDDGNRELESCAHGAASCTVCDEDCHERAGATHECGDGETDAPEEQCDDGNAVTETCDYGQSNCTVCTETCQNAAGATSYCNDGTIDSANDEDCEDGNAVTETCNYGATSCSVCSSLCRTVAGATSYCGNSQVDAANGEECDDGDSDPADGCDACQVVAVVTCGNDVIDAGNGENCDDGNTGNLDGCNAACQREAGWTCPTPGQACVETCGDGMTVGDEACDDDNSVDSDYCSNDCRTRRFCGDNSTQTNAGEQCDDGNTVTEGCTYGAQSCTVCDATCHSVAGATSFCGDTVVDAAHSEECDAGGATETCRSDCKLQRYCTLEFNLTGQYQVTNTTLGLGDGTFAQSGGRFKVRLPDNGSGVPGAHASSLNRTGVLFYEMPISFTKTITLLATTITTNITSRAGTAENTCPLNRGTLAGNNVTWVSCPYRPTSGGSGHCTTDWTPTHQSVPAITPTLGCLPTTGTGNIDCAGSSGNCGLGGLNAGSNPINDSWFQPQNTAQFSNAFANTTMNGLGGPTDCPASDPSRSGSNSYTNKLETPERATSRGWIATSGTRASITCGQLPADCD